MHSRISVRPLQENEVAAADHIMRVAFGTFIGLPEPASFLGSANYVRPRWQANPGAAIAAHVDGELAGSNFVTCWGSVGFFGPLSIHPKFWDTGVGKRLVEPAMELLERAGVRHAGLFTFPHSPKHVSLYQKFGFSPRFLTAVMSKAVEMPSAAQGSLFSQLSPTEQAAVLAEARELTEEILPGLNLESEIRSVESLRLGETVLLHEGSRLAGFAVCHIGAGPEAGEDVCYVKFAAARPGVAAAESFSQLVDACEAVALQKDLKRIVAGVNTARIEAYRHLLAAGYRTDIQGVVMQRPEEAGYNRPGAWIIDDWR